MTALGRRAVLAGSAIVNLCGGSRFGWAQNRRPMLQADKQTLYQRVVVRPGATLQATPAAASVGSPVSGFSTFYVYDRRDGETGWVEVGSAADGRTRGWIAAAKLIDWPHAMIGAFTNPAARQPVLFLETRDQEKALITGPDPGAGAERLRQAALAHQPGPVLAIEPANLVDITHQFYLLPILTAEQIETDGGATVRLLEVISAPAEPPLTPPAPTVDALRDFKAGLLFLIDTTASMQPYIDTTSAVVKAIIARIGASPVKDHFRFGVVGYRDSLLDTPRLEYTTRVFMQPDFHLPTEAVLDPLAHVRESPVSSSEYDEDPIAGLKTCIEEVEWGSLGGRYIILITDAGARDANNAHSATHLGIPEIRELARAHNIAVFVVHLLTPAGLAAHDYPRAAAQYRSLTTFDGAAPLYFQVPGGSRDAFDHTAATLTDALLQQVAATTGQPVQASNGSAPATPQMQHQVEIVSTAMRLAYLGRVEQTRAPDVIRAFTSDRDMGDMTRRSLGVRVLLTRDQLSDLAQTLRSVLDAGMASRVDPTTFFGQLRTAFAAAARGASQAVPLDRIGSLLGEYLEGLPYRSDIMNVSQDDWLAMGGIKQADILSGIEAKIRLYQEFQSQSDLWVNLAGADHPGEAAFPVPIEALP
jgi:serine/threonine-protein kinase PpkA